MFFDLKLEVLFICFRGSLPSFGGSGQTVSFPKGVSNQIIKLQFVVLVQWYLTVGNFHNTNYSRFSQIEKDRENLVTRKKKVAILI